MNNTGGHSISDFFMICLDIGILWSIVFPEDIKRPILEGVFKEKNQVVQNLSIFF